ncbi:MAG: hypothetical protein K8S23_17185 [Candidatus Cloacimonetes bacterium]|nr:hypothetical protein [Candidatus Cloacimonadota bacterium]
MRLLILFFLFFNILFAIDEIDLNFFTEPHFKIKNIEEIKINIESKTQNDTIRHYNFFAGKILEKSASDDEIVEFLNVVDCAYCTPTDYSFDPHYRDLLFKLLASNISGNFRNLISYKVIETDSMKIGIMAIYSPDFAVKNNISDLTEFDLDVFGVTKELSQKLQKKTNFIILLSNLSKYIDDDLVENLPIDVVISFDYQPKKNEMLSNKRTFWYGIKTFKNKFGKLRLTYQSGKISYKWHKVKLK